MLTFILILNLLNFCKTFSPVLTHRSGSFFYHNRINLKYLIAYLNLNENLSFNNYINCIYKFAYRYWRQNYFILNCLIPVFLDFTSSEQIGQKHWFEINLNDKVSCCFIICLVAQLLNHCIGLSIIVYI